MKQEDILLLSRMKKLIRVGKRRFESRKDRDYLECLSNLEITENEAWDYILTLNKNFYYVDKKLDYYKDNGALIFKRLIKEKMAYIKLKIEYNKNGEEVVCISFHEDNK